MNMVSIEFDIAEPVSIVKKTAEGGALTGVKYL